MSEPRKNHLTIDGGQVKEEDHVSSYKPIPESDTDFRTSKTSISKSKEKASPDGAEEKLLLKEDEAKIVRVDMADAKYVVGDHRNGDAKIELDANKRQFSGLTKEELLKYADDPFWVNLRWGMFVLFWAMWLAMLAGAITIIVRAPKCAPPMPREWFEKWPLAETYDSDSPSGDFDAVETFDFSDLESKLPVIQKSMVQGIFVDVPTYDVDKPGVLDKFKAFVAKAKEFSIKVIVDLTPNFVSIDHPWFVQSENRSAVYSDYFVWRTSNEFDKSTNERIPPNNWVSVLNKPAWNYSTVRGEFYLHQYGANQPDLNFNNDNVVTEFKSVLEKWIRAGAAGVRLNKARQLLVNTAFENETQASGRGTDLSADHTQYSFWRHSLTSDQPKLDSLLNKFAAVVDANGPSPGSGATVFTLKEDGSRPELYLLDRNATFRPPAAAALTITNVTAAAAELNNKLEAHWPAIQLKGDAETAPELATFALLLPATPVFNVEQLQRDDNDTSLSELVSLRGDATLEHGNHSILAVPAGNSTENKLLACARWKSGHTGYLAVFNPTEEELRANLTAVPTVPEWVSVHHTTPALKLYTNYTKNSAEQAQQVLVPRRSTVVIYYVPQTAAES